MRAIVYTVFGILFLTTAVHCKSGLSSDKISVLVVTGGHSYDTAEFVAMFSQMDGMETELVLKPDAWQLLDRGRQFDVIVFYDMWQAISEEEKLTFLNEFESGTGMVFLHHSLVSHQEWKDYTLLVGGRYVQPGSTLDSTQFSDYRHDIDLQVHITDPNHPVTRGVGDFEIHDEGYSNTLQLPGVHNLLETVHPDCDRYIGWSHEVKNSRVVYLMGGHDKYAFENESFIRLLENAIRWTGITQGYK
ncbi:MAG TPA: ThuA domain-containing protein [Bacteroides sp.]|nr:ThuA domain-containing protein [Bacteroides sp.]